MKKDIYRGFAAVLAGILLLIPSGSALAGTGSAEHVRLDYREEIEWPEAPEVSANSVCLIELNTGAVLYEKNADVKSYPASTTKIMTALLTLENAELSEEVTFSNNAIYDIEEGGHHWEFEEGEVLTVDECLQFLLCESVNEAGYALAEHIAGSLSAFSDMMNERAKELGATGTHFNNPHGLNDENHYTTARDMAMILWGCVQNEKFRQYASLRSVSLTGRKIRTEGFSTYYNHHLMMRHDSDYYDPDVVCGKTGYTSIAGNTLVTYASRGDMDVVCVIMQGLSDRFDDTRKLLDYAFDQFEIRETDTLKDIPDVPGADELIPEAKSAGNWILLPKGSDWDQAECRFAAAMPNPGDTAAGSGMGGLAGISAGNSSSSEEEEKGENAAAASDQEKGFLGERIWSYDGVELLREPVMIDLDAVSRRKASLQDEAGVREEETEEVTAEAFVPEETDEEGEGLASREFFGWQVAELAELLALAVVFFILLVLLILVIRARHRAKRAKRRDSRRKEGEPR